jgi:uncharacterized paraquat-inducible protein A
MAMTTDFDFAKTYSEMEDEELREVARDASDLVPAAKAALNTELSKRGLDARIAPAEEEEAAERSRALYCPYCHRETDDPLTCSECSSIICRRCGTKLQTPEEREEDQAASQAAG